MKKDFSIILLMLLSGFLSVLLLSSTDNPVTDKSVKEQIRENYRIYAIPLPDSLEFAGETVPLEYPYVREKFDKELLINVYWQSNTLLKLKRAAKYFPVIEPILKKYHIPDDFKYLALAESGLEHVTSPAGAKGIWQLMPQTARKYGLRINDEIDERYNLEKSTRAACQYLSEAYKKFGSWTMAAAAYNRGMKGLEQAVSDQNETDYYKLYLNPETARYIYRIIALKEIIEHPSEYGFRFRKEDLYTFPAYKSIKITGTVDNWPDFASHYGISYGELRYLNPWIRDYSFRNKDQDTLIVKIPLFE
jgi:hypothetical protein